MNAENLRGELQPDGTVEFEHGVEKHPDFIQVAEDVFGEMTSDTKLMTQRWWEWLEQGMPGLADRIGERGPVGRDVATFQPYSREQVERALGQTMRSVFLEHIGKEADQEAGWLLSNPAHLEKWRAAREDAEAERQWEESQRRYA